MDKSPYGIASALWYIFVLVMTPKALYDATVQDGFAGFMMGLFAMMILFLLPMILRGK